MYATIQDKLSPLLDKSKHILLNNLEFIVAGSTYVAATITDYLYTIPGINSVGEGNPAIIPYISELGADMGLKICKASIGINVLIGLKAVDSAYKANKTNFKAKYVLYPGAILTTLGGLSWLLVK